MMHKFFIKRFKTFFLIMMLPSLLLIFVSSSFVYRNSMDSISQESATTLNTVKDHLESVLSNSAYQYELLTYNPRLVLSLEKLLRHNDFEYSDLVFLNSVETLLSAVAQSHDYIDSIYLYLDGFGNFFSSEVGIQEILSSKDTEWFSMYQNMNLDEKFWIQKRSYQKYTYTDSSNFISLFQRMTNMKGVIVINMDIKQIEKVLNNTGPSGKKGLYLLDQDNQILCSNTDGRKLISPLEIFLSEQTQAENKSWVQIQNNYYLYEQRFDSAYQISYLSLIPLNHIFMQFKPTLWILLGVFLSNCMITLLLSFYITKRNFEQITHIITAFSDAEHGDIPEKKNSSVQDEYDIILNNVINVFLSSSFLKHQLAEKQYRHELMEMKTLQLQINPHFLFNTLQSLDFEALRVFGQPGTVNHMIHNLSDILKYSLENPLKSITLRDELNYLKKYADIQQLRLGDKFIIYYEVEEKLFEIPVFRLMLQPLVENSLSHGIAPLECTGYIKVRVYERNNFVYFIVIDTGVGLDRDEIIQLHKRIKDEHSQNIGLTNINRRLILKYGEECKLRIQSKKGMGTCISYCIPLSSQNPSLNL